MIYRGLVRFVVSTLGWARLPFTRLGGAGPGVAWRGGAWLPFSRLVEAGLGVARRGLARHGMAPLFSAWLGGAEHGPARRRTAWQGKAPDLSIRLSLVPFYDSTLTQSAATVTLSRESGSFPAGTRIVVYVGEREPHTVGEKSPELFVPVQIDAAEARSVLDAKAEIRRRYYEYTFARLEKQRAEMNRAWLEGFREAIRVAARAARWFRP